MKINRFVERVMILFLLAVLTFPVTVLGVYEFTTFRTLAATIAFAAV